MSKWTDAGFPDKLHLAPVPTILYALYAALAERMGINKPAMLEYISRFPIDDLIMKAFLCYYCRGKDGWFYEILPALGYETKENDKTLRYLCENVLDVEFIPNHYLATKYSAEYAKCRYHIINSMMAPREVDVTAYNLMKSPDREAWLKRDYGNGFILNNYRNVGYSDYSAATKVDVVNGFMFNNFYASRPADFVFDLKFYIYATHFAYESGPTGDIPYNSFNSGIDNKSTFQKKVENCQIRELENNFYPLLDNLFSVPVALGEVGMSLFMHHLQEVQEIYRNEDHVIQKADLFFLTDATPYLEYLDFEGELEIPEIPEVPYVPESGGGGGDSGDDDDDKPENPHDPYPDLDLNAYVVICRHVYEGDKKEVIQKQYAIVRYGYVSSRLPAEYKHIAWYPLYTERVYQQPPDYPVWQWEYCFIKTNLAYKDNLELLELWAKTNLEPDYFRAYF